VIYVRKNLAPEKGLKVEESKPAAAAVQAAAPVTPETKPKTEQKPELPKTPKPLPNALTKQFHKALTK
jgi:hypothetical protein